MDYKLSPLVVYKAPLREVLSYDWFFEVTTPEHIEDRGGIMIQDNLLSLRTLRSGSTVSTLELSMPSDDPKAAFLEPESFIRFNGKVYLIKTTEERKQGGESVLHVYAERYWYLFLRGGYGYLVDFDFYDAGSAIRYGLIGWSTGEDAWTVGAADPQGVLPFEESQTSTTLEILKEIESLWGGYLVFDYEARRISLLLDPGEDKGVYFTYSRDIKTISRIIDTSDLTTRMWLKRADGLYVEPPYEENYQWTDRTYDGIMEFDETYSDASAHLVARELLKESSMPKLTYEISLGGLHDRDSVADQFDVLDKVSVFDESFNRVVKARVEEMDIDWLEPERSKIVLGSRLKNLGSTGAYIPPNFGGVGESPITPDGITVSSMGYWEEEVPSSNVVVSWLPVTKTVKGKDVTISYYMVDISPLTTYNTPQTSTEVRSLDPGITFNVSVCAVSDTGVPSAWSPPMPITTQGPTTPPEPPEPPEEPELI